MKESLYFFLEPYVYLKSSPRGVLLVNLLDDTTLLFEDKASIRIGSFLQSSVKNTIKIKEDDKNIPIIERAITNFMGDIVFANLQPLQFNSEFEHVSGRNAYLKSIIYSKNNIGEYISDCTLFINPGSQDCQDYIRFMTGIDSVDIKQYHNFSFVINEKDIDTYIKELITINPDITFKICGFDIKLLDYILKKYKNILINPIISLRTIRLYPDILSKIKENNLKYTLLLDLFHDNFNYEIFDDLCAVNVKIINDKDMNVALNLLEKGYKIKICPVLNSQNIDFIKSLLTIHKEDLLHLENKYRTIKINNVINSNFWGHLYLFPKGKMCYSLKSDKFFDFNHLYETYKSDFFNGIFEWTSYRNFLKCKDCIFQYLCPAPDYIEIFLRENGLVECLVKNEKVTS